MVKFEILKVFSQYVGKSRRKVVWVEKKAIRRPESLSWSIIKHFIECPLSGEHGSSDNMSRILRWKWKWSRGT